MATDPSNDIDADLARLDQGIRRLKVQYDMFLAGALDREPIELRGQLDALIRKHTQHPSRSYAQRFRLSTLVGRFNSFTELWGKRVRSMEEGDHRVPGMAERLGIKERLITRCRFSDPGKDETALRLFHRRYVELSRRRGREKSMSFEDFSRGVVDQTRRLRDRAGCSSIELLLFERDDKIELKARPGR